MLDYAVRRRLVAAALGVALLGALWLAFARAEEPSGEIVTVLQPGENLVGWIADEAPVGDLFAAAPAIEVVWAWDAQGRRWQAASPRAPDELHSLQTLRPGMGLLVWVGGDQPVEWRRSAMPARGLVELRPGRNLVAWTGPDDSSITWLSKGIGVSLVSAGVPSSGETGWSIYDPEDAATAEAFPAVNRGDALWVDVSRNINWLQPTGVLPAIEFPGGASQLLQDRVRADVESMLDFYGETYAIQADFAALTIYLPKDRESYDAAAANDAALRPVRAEFWEEVGGWAGSFAAIAKQGFAGVSPDRSPRGILSHEYFHVIQRQLYRQSPLLEFGTGPNPNWLVEGMAEWMTWRHSEAQEFRIDGRDRDGAFADASRELRSKRASLESSLQPYTHGLLAADLLAQHAGGGALIDFWRLQSGLGDDSGALWPEAFLEAFGVSVADFYSAFCRFRRGETMPDYSDDSPLCLDDDVRILSGVLVDDDGAAISGAAILVPLDRTGVSSSVDHLGGRTDSQGRFAIRYATVSYVDGPWLWPWVPPIELSDESLGVRVVINDLCEGWYAGDGLVGRTPAAIPFEDNVADIRIQLAAETCRRIEGAVVGPDGVGLPGAEVVALSHPSSERHHQNTASDGSFSFGYALSRGSYSLGVHLRDGCIIWFAGGDAVSYAPGSFRWPPEFLEGIRVVVPENACRWEVRGRLVDFYGDGVASGWVWLSHHDNRYARGQRTGPDGSFSFAVPLPGEYQFSIASGDLGCRGWYYSEGGATFDQNEATLLSLGTQDISDLVLWLPEDACGDR